MATSIEPNLSEIPISSEFPKVFKDVPGLSLDRKIEFTNDLVHGIIPTSKDSY